jgi:hypothetical protein
MKTSLTTLLVLIVLDWTREFHVHIDALNYSIGAMLVQNHDNTIDRLVYYASQLMIQTENNYLTTEKETFAMIYALKKSHHYLLGNKFTLIENHQALIYLVNKPTIIGQITRWLLLL